jgi:hypothetical protein
VPTLLRDIPSGSLQGEGYCYVDAEREGAVASSSQLIPEHS